MALLPYIFDYNWQWPRRLLDQNFGVALSPDDLLSVTASPFIPRIRPYWSRDMGSTIKANKDKFQINVDVQHFAPEEITVKTSNGFIVIEGRHEEKKDEHGYISRQFSRRFKLPEQCNEDAVESRLSSDGVLTVVAPKKEEAVKGERSVPISHTGPVRKEICDEGEKQNVEEKQDKVDEKK